MFFLTNQSFKNKKAIIRVDLNVPLDASLKVTDATRIIACRETIDYVINNGGTCILMTHLGRPKGKEKALSLGNLIGSNIFNIASVLGLTALISPIKLEDNLESKAVLTNDILWMLGFAIILLPLVFLPKRYTFSRYKGLIIFIGYAVFVGLTFS